MNKLAIVGSRIFDNYILLCYYIDSIIKTYNINTIISGGANGADSLAKKYANENNFKLIEYLPDWKLYGKKAGFLRNELIILNCDILIAFWDGESKGTKNSINLAKKYNKKHFVINFNKNVLDNI